MVEPGAEILKGACERARVRRFKGEVELRSPCRWPGFEQAQQPTFNAAGFQLAQDMQHFRHRRLREDGLPQ
ncbi:MAG: hypothetical protein OHK0021_11390 [Bryobacter sp.]